MEKVENYLMLNDKHLSEGGALLERVITSRPQRSFGEPLPTMVQRCQRFFPAPFRELASFATGRHIGKQV